jgi:hypothetical protein
MKTKRVHLLETLKVADGQQCTELKTLSLSLLGDLFMDTNADQAERMYNMALLFGKKMKSPWVICFSAHQLKSLLSRKPASDATRQAEASLDQLLSEWTPSLSLE